MAPPAADPLLGQQIEGYRIIRSVGHGGMGVIYEAVHPGIGQRAAVKVLFPSFSRDEDAVSRFVAEARAASRVQHPGLVKIFNHGRLPDGTAYIMMEFLSGESLQARLLRLRQTAQRMPLPEVVRIAGQVASALDAVHREGIVHRDLKPANLLSFADAEASAGERIKVVDFGIAKFLSGSTADVDRTTVGKFLGTALYASPEQCQMTGQVGAKADVYSLGVILYEMLAGQPPFVAEHPGAVIAMHLSSQPRSLWDVSWSVPTPLCLLVHEMLRKEPERRPSMKQIGDRLAELRLDAAEWPYRLWRHKSRVAAMAGGALLALALLGTIAGRLPAVRVRPTPAGRSEPGPSLPTSLAALPSPQGGVRNENALGTTMSSSSSPVPAAWGRHPAVSELSALPRGAEMSVRAKAKRAASKPAMPSRRPDTPSAAASAASPSESVVNSPTPVGGGNALPAEPPSPQHSAAPPPVKPKQDNDDDMAFH